MTTEQKEKIREEFLQRFFEPTFIDYLRPYDTSFRDEEKIDWWLSIIDKELEEERNKILTKVMEHAQQNTYEGEEARVYKTTISEVIDLIHNK